jgi:hypothetical protein
MDVLYGWSHYYYINFIFYYWVCFLMRGNHNNILLLFDEWVKLAKGDSMLVYEAVWRKENPSIKDIEDYIKKNSK